MKGASPSAFFDFMDIRNIAIIAHVDHGKTTLVDGMLKQTHTFRANEAQMSQTTILDSNELERERGITILAKNTAVFYKGVKINIVDTPGHADFGGEVERVLNMADAALLVIDAAEGPLPQTKFVLKKALATGLKIIVVINKIDRPDAQPQETLRHTEELFLKLVHSADQLNFPVIYAIGRQGRSGPDPRHLTGDLTPLFELILREVPPAACNLDQPVQMLVSTLDYDSHVGKIGVGRIRRGTLRVGQTVCCVTPSGQQGTFKVERLFTSQGIKRQEVTEAPAGDIVGLAGVPDIQIGQTIVDPASPQPLPPIQVEEPTLKITIGANASPLSGREGKFVTSRQIGERLGREKEVNLGLKIQDVGGGYFEVVGRGELHLAVLLETMRREHFELQVSKPEVVLKDNQEPYEEVTIDVPDDYTGAVTAEMGRRRAIMTDMHTDEQKNTRMVFEISQRNLLGARNVLLTATKGVAVINTLPLGYKDLGPAAPKLRNGALIAHDTGKAMAYSLENAQERGTLFIDPGEQVYEGMVIGLSSRENDMDINVCKEKAKTNVRSSTKEMKIVLTPPVKMSLEQSLDFVADDELLEITPHHTRLRKKYLTKLDRVRNSRRLASS